VNNQSLWISVAVFIVELALIFLCRHYQKKPVDPLRPRLIPLNLVFLALVIIAFATLAHIVSLVTGTQVKPRNKMAR
jgi:hypothetical protein